MNGKIITFISLEKPRKRRVPTADDSSGFNPISDFSQLHEAERRRALQFRPEIFTASRGVRLVYVADGSKNRK